MRDSPIPRQGSSIDIAVADTLWLHHCGWQYIQQCAYYQPWRFGECKYFLRLHLIHDENLDENALFILATPILTSMYLAQSTALHKVEEFGWL